MKHIDGSFSLAAQNPSVPGCTVSSEILPGVQCFSLAPDTDISAESYPDPVLQFNLRGENTVYDADAHMAISVPGSAAIVKPAYRNIGVKASEESIYLEIHFRKESSMNKLIKAGEVFQLKDLVPYQEGKIVNMDIVSDSHMKFVVMSFTKGTGLAEHAAPGEAIVFALEGKAVIGYEGKDYPIQAGEQFHFAKGGLHSVKTDGNFKMALLLVLDA